MHFSALTVFHSSLWTLRSIGCAGAFAHVVFSGGKDNDFQGIFDFRFRRLQEAAGGMRSIVFGSAGSLRAQNMTDESYTDEWRRIYWCVYASARQPNKLGGAHEEHRSQPLSAGSETSSRRWRSAGSLWDHNEAIKDAGVIQWEAARFTLAAAPTSNIVQRHDVRRLCA